MMTIGTLLEECCFFLEVSSCSMKRSLNVSVEKFWRNTFIKA